MTRFVLGGKECNIFCACAYNLKSYDLKEKRIMKIFIFFSHVSLTKIVLFVRILSEGKLCDENSLAGVPPTSRLVLTENNAQCNIT